MYIKKFKTLLPFWYVGNYEFKSTFNNDFKSIFNIFNIYKIKNFKY